MANRLDKPKPLQPASYWSHEPSVSATNNRSISGVVTFGQACVHTWSGSSSLSVKIDLRPNFLALSTKPDQDQKYSLDQDKVIRFRPTHCKVSRRKLAVSRVAPGSWTSVDVIDVGQRKRRHHHTLRSYAKICV